MRYKTQGPSAIPPEIRALVRVVNDIDHTQFPELVTDGPNPPARELETLLTEITDRGLSKREFLLFQATYMEMQHHLRGVDAAMVAGSQVNGILTLTFRLDAICTEAGVRLDLVFPNVKAAHNFFLDIISFRASDNQAPIFFCLIDTICTLLARAVEELQSYVKTAEEDEERNNSVKLGLKSMNDNIAANTPTITTTSTVTNENVEENCRHQSINNDGYQQDARNEDKRSSMPWIREGMTIPDGLDGIFADIDGDIGMHLAHLRWFVEVCRTSDSFDITTYIGDAIAEKMWNFHVGEDVWACFIEEFSSALQVFPKWSHEPIMNVLNYKGCGVVSLYTLKRLLDVWGSFLLLDCNMQGDLRTGLFDLGHSLEYQSRVFAKRPDAADGDCIATLTETPGEVAVLVLLPRRSTDSADKDDTHGPFSTWTTRLTQDTGAWVAGGLTEEGYDSVHDACAAFPELFRHPCGTSFNDLGDQPGGTLAQRNFSVTPPTSSNLHRACFRNNNRYVKTLLGRGSALLVNIALLDPMISSQFCWTPLLCAVNNPNGDPGDIVQMLLEAGADVHITDAAECTALYYAIANGCATSTRLLLEHTPNLHTSHSSNPLLISLGAHHFHARESDVRRLSDLIPSTDMLEVLLPYQRNLQLVRLAADIILGKLQGKERVQQPTDDPSLWLSNDGEVEQRTQEEEENLLDVITYHGRLCRMHDRDVWRAARLLLNHCFFLSCREHFGQSECNL